MSRGACVYNRGGHVDAFENLTKFDVMHETGEICEGWGEGMGQGEDNTLTERHNGSLARKIWDVD